MKKIFFYILFLIITVQQISAQVINSRYKARSFEEMLAPLQMYTDAYNKAERDLEDYYTRFSREVESPRPDYHMALYYIEKCISLNVSFEKRLINHGVLLYNKGYIQYSTKDYRSAYNSFHNAHLAGHKEALKAMDICREADPYLVKK